MKGIEWPVCQHQLIFPFANESKTMAAWIRMSLRDPNQSWLSIRINTAAPNPLTLVSRDSPNLQLHAFILLATMALRSTVEHSKQMCSIRFLLSKFSSAVTTPPNPAVVRTGGSVVPVAGAGSARRTLPRSASYELPVPASE
jgi:hypothetical protein